MDGLLTAIRERIAEKGVTQATVARTLGIGRQTFSRKLNGHNDFSVAELTRLAEALDTTVIDLMQSANQIAHDGVIILQARHVDIGGEAA